jgi:biotin carboxylase
MLKATAGGGGKGMRAVWKEEDLLKHGKALVKSQLLLLGMTVYLGWWK